MATKLEHKKIKSYRMSKFVFAPHIFVLLASLVYLFQSQSSLLVSLFVIIANIVFAAPTFLYFKTYKFTITNRKIYIKNDFLRINQSLDLVKNLCYFKYNQGIMGLIFNYGNFEFVDENEKIYRIDKLPFPKQIETIIVEQTNKYLADLGIDDKIGSDKPEVFYESLTETDTEKDTETLESVEVNETQKEAENTQEPIKIVAKNKNAQNK